MNTHFKPQYIPKWVTIKNFLDTGKTINYNFVEPDTWYPSSWKLNHKTLGKIHSKLHYLARHAPKPINKKWMPVYKRFYKIHFGSIHGSIRYLTNWSCHSWM